MDFLITLFFIALIAGGISFFIFIFVHSGKSLVKQSKEKEKFHPLITSNMKHVEGLPVGNGVITTVYYYYDKLVFVVGEQKFSLDKSRISSISTASGSDISSKASGAAAGAMLFGGISGAAIGTLLGSTLYFIVVYEKDGTTKSIVLDTDMSIPYANKIKKAFNEEKGTNDNQIEL